MLVGLFEQSAVAGCALSLALLGTASAVAQVPGDDASVTRDHGVAEQATAPGSDPRDAVPADATAADPNGAERATAPATDSVIEEQTPTRATESSARPHLDAARLAVAEQRGRSVYRRRCASCHGMIGDSRGPAARFLEVVPRDFTTGAYKWRTTPSGELPSDADLMRTVRRGAPGTSMPSWDGRLSLRDMWAAIQYIKTFSSRFLEEAPVAPLVLPTTVPTFDAAARRRGRLVYVLLQCWTCHGTRGRGDGPAAATLLDDNGRRAIAYDFTRGRLRGGARPIDVYRTFVTGVNGTPMPSYDEALLVGRDGYPDLTRYRPVLSASGLRRLAAFVRAMPTSDDLWAMPEERRLAWGTRLRWDLVAYVMSLGRQNALGDYLTAAPYQTR